MRRRTVVPIALSLLGSVHLARAVEAAPTTTPAPTPTEEQIEAAVKADAEKPSTANAPLSTAPVDEAPPPLPHKKGIVLEGSVGALTFFGQFRHIAPTAPWMHVQLGYELFRWLMVFGEGELAFTDTSESQDPSKARAFPIFGFGAGARGTVHATERVALFVQGSIGALKVDVPSGAFAVLGFKNAESFGVSLGARGGVEWYAMDRHLALGLAAGVRSATGFAKTIGSTDTPLMGDFSASIRYTF